MKKKRIAKEEITTQTTSELEQMAQHVMRNHGFNSIMYVDGYWFTEEHLAKERSQQTGKEIQVFTLK